MERVNNRQDLVDLRRRLRNDPTKAERLLWKRIQRSQLDGMKFRRQHSIGRYVVDFYCPGERIAIELDGSVHGSREQMVKDRQKQGCIERLCIQVLRFDNHDVLDNMEGVLKAILRAKNNHP